MFHLTLILNLDTRNCSRCSHLSWKNQLENCINFHIKLPELIRLLQFPTIFYDIFNINLSLCHLILSLFEFNLFFWLIYLFGFASGFFFLCFKNPKFKHIQAHFMNFIKLTCEFTNLKMIVGKLSKVRNVNTRHLCIFIVNFQITHHNYNIKNYKMTDNCRH